MPCDELLQLRSKATQIKNRIDEQRRKARAKAAVPRPGRASGKSEYVPYLERKLSRLAARIEAHMAEHNCQE
jgi:hypothetical protein